jgi:hypothetical protein
MSILKSSGDLPGRSDHSAPQALRTASASLRGIVAPPLERHTTDMGFVRGSRCLRCIDPWVSKISRNKASRDLVLKK